MPHIEVTLAPIRGETERDLQLRVRSDLNAKAKSIAEVADRYLDFAPSMSFNRNHATGVITGHLPYKVGGLKPVREEPIGALEELVEPEPYCEACDYSYTTETNWSRHINSTAHINKTQEI